MASIASNDARDTAHASASKKVLWAGLFLLIAVPTVLFLLGAGKIVAHAMCGLGGVTLYGARLARNQIAEDGKIRAGAGTLMIAAALVLAGGLALEYVLSLPR